MVEKMISLMRKLMRLSRVKFVYYYFKAQQQSVSVVAGLEQK